MHQCQGPAIVHAGLLAHLNETEPWLILLVTPVLFLLQQVKMSTVREVYFPDQMLMSGLIHHHWLYSSFTIQRGQNVFVTQPRPTKRGKKKLAFIS